MIPFKSISFVVFITCLACEVGYFLLRRRHRGHESRFCSVFRLASFFWRPVMAVAAVNIWMRMSDSSMSSRLTYPFYANPWSRNDMSFASRIAGLLSSEWSTAWLALSAILASLAALAATLTARRQRQRRSPNYAIAIPALFVLAFAFFVSLASVPYGFFTGEGQKCSMLANWHESGATMLYALPVINSPGRKQRHYLRDFHKLQGQLEPTIHAASHPPLASLFVRWIGSVAGVDYSDPSAWRDAKVRLRFALGQTAVSALNAILVFLIGAAMFNTNTGLLAAILWLAAPSVSSYATFAPDMNYAIFFHGAILLTWLTATAQDWKRALRFAFPLGLCFSMLVMMTFSWCIATTIFAVAVVAFGIRNRRGACDILLRGAPALAAMALIAGWTILHHHIDYVAIYRNSSGYVASFYHHRSFSEALLALVGGQVEWLSLLGPMACSGFIAAMLQPQSRAPSVKAPAGPRDCDSDGKFFAALLLSVFAVPILFGPPCLKHEVARCWIWMAAVPLAISARYWQKNFAPPVCGIVVLGSAFSALFLRLFVRFLA